jgi:hypothetical protein
LLISININLIHIIIFLIIFLIIIYYVYKKCNKNIENFSDVDLTTINNLINKQYKADIEAIRNLSNYATYLMNGNPSGTDVKVSGALSATTSISTPTLNIGKSTLNELILFDLINKQSGIVGTGSINEESKSTTLTVNFKVLIIFL